MTTATERLSAVDREVIALLEVAPRATWGLLGLYESLRASASRVEIDASVAKLARGCVITSNRLGLWSLVPLHLSRSSQR